MRGQESQTWSRPHMVWGRLFVVAQSSPCRLVEQTCIIHLDAMKSMLPSSIGSLGWALRRTGTGTAEVPSVAHDLLLPSLCGVQRRDFDKLVFGGALPLLQETQVLQSEVIPGDKGKLAIVMWSILFRVGHHVWQSQLAIQKLRLGMLPSVKSRPHFARKARTNEPAIQERVWRELLWTWGESCWVRGDIKDCACNGDKRCSPCCHCLKGHAWDNYRCNCLTISLTTSLHCIYLGGAGSSWHRLHLCWTYHPGEDVYA